MEPGAEHVCWQALSCILSFQLTTILTSTFQKNQQRLEEGNWLAWPHSLREEEGEMVLRQVLLVGLLCDLRLEPPPAQAPVSSLE